MSRRLRGRLFCLLAGLTGAVWSVACAADGSRVPNGPTALATAIQTNQSPSNGLEFTAVVGTGSGILNDAATSNDGGFVLNAQVNINVHGVPGGTVLYVRRASDLGLGAQQADGICQRANAGLFMPVPVDVGGPPAIIETSPGGAGAIHIDIHANSPLLPEGGQLDVVYRLVDALPPAVPTIDLRTPCFMFTVK